MLLTIIKYKAASVLVPEILERGPRQACIGQATYQIAHPEQGEAFSKWCSSSEETLG